MNKLPEAFVTMALVLIFASVVALVAYGIYHNVTYRCVESHVDGMVCHTTGSFSTCQDRVVCDRYVNRRTGEDE